MDEADCKARGIPSRFRQKLPLELLETNLLKLSAAAVSMAFKP